jgi:hypothetical protein
MSRFLVDITVRTLAGFSIAAMIITAWVVTL